MANVESEVKQQKKEAKAAVEVDPLDAFMAGIQQDLKKKKKKQKGDVYTRREPRAQQQQFALQQRQPYQAQRKRKAEAPPWGAQPQEPPFKRKKTSDELAYENLMSELMGSSSKPAPAPAAAPAAEVDPLDAFMANVESEVKQQKKE